MPIGLEAGMTNEGTVNGREVYRIDRIGKEDPHREARGKGQHRRCRVDIQQAVLDNGQADLPVRPARAGDIQRRRIQQLGGVLRRVEKDLR